jgi:hypothetical protein
MARLLPVYRPSRARDTEACKYNRRLHDACKADNWQTQSDVSSERWPIYYAMRVISWARLIISQKLVEAVTDV